MPAVDTRAFRILSLAASLAIGCGDAESSGTDGTPDAGGAGGADNGGGGTGGTEAVTECFGNPLPERAIASLVRPAPPASLDAYAPTAGWRMASPEQVGMDPAAVEAALSFTVPGAATQGLLIVRHGHIVGERYFPGFEQSTPHESFSMAKSVTSALVGIAIEAGLLSGTEERICEYYDEWDCNDASDLRSTITIHHAMNISTGLQWVEDWRAGSVGNDAFNPDILGTALSRPVVDEPGTRMRYSTGDPALLTGVIQGATGRTVLDYANERIFGPLGISGVAWASDAQGRTTAYAGLSLTVRDFAKFGLLYLQEGNWDGEQLVPADWVRETTQPDDYCVDQYEDLWHINASMRLGTPDPSCPEIVGCRPLDVADLPGDAYFAEGAFGQGIYVIPSRDIVAVRVAMDALDSNVWDEVSRTFLGLILDAVVETSR
jgi:CubicO group peptidase (beta-lactamase class C family)